jgi:hypothetical protein
VIEGDFQAPNWLDLQRLHHNPLMDEGSEGLAPTGNWLVSQAALGPFQKRGDFVR